MSAFSLNSNNYHRKFNNPQTAVNKDLQRQFPRKLHIRKLPDRRCRSKNAFCTREKLPAIRQDGFMRNYACLSALVKSIYAENCLSKRLCGNILEESIFHWKIYIVGCQRPLIASRELIALVCMSLILYLKYFF